MNTDIRQTKLFAQFMRSIGWESELVHTTFIYLRKFPFIGYFGKIPRPNPNIPMREIMILKSRKKLFELRIAPNIIASSKYAKKIRTDLIRNNFQIELFPFNPTTTIHINLKRSENEIFQSFTSAKRRAIRRALKNDIRIKESNDIDSFIRIRKYQYRPLGFLITKETKSVFTTFSPTNAKLLLAYRGSSATPLSGILMLYTHATAYYWFASSLPEGKKLFAPTLLVWHALKRAKKLGCKTFDFEGIYDERFPKAAESWKGFTKFKEGFGGEKVVYIENFKRAHR